MKYKNIIWDWNGTILDDAWVFVDVMNSILLKISLPTINLEKYKNNFDFPISNYYKYLGITYSADYIKISNLFIKEYKKRMYEAKMMPGVLDLIESFHDYKVSQFILSASHQSILEKQVKYYKLQKYMEEIIGVDNYSAKGKKQLGVDWLKKKKFDKNTCLYIGDTIYDYKIASVMNIDSILITMGHNSKSRLINAGANTIDRFNEFIF